MHISLRPGEAQKIERSTRLIHVVREVYFPPCRVNNAGVRANSFYFDVGGYYRGGGCQYRVNVRGQRLRKRDLRIIPFVLILVMYSYWAAQEFLNAGDQPLRLFFLAFGLSLTLLVFLQGRADSYLGPYLISSIVNGLARDRCRASEGVGTSISNICGTMSLAECRDRLRGSVPSIAYRGQAGTKSRSKSDFVLSALFHAFSVAGFALSVLFALRNGQRDTFLVIPVSALFSVYMWWPLLRHSAWTGVRGFEEKTSSERRAWQGFDGPSELRIYEDRLEHLWEEQLTTIQRQRIVRIERHDPRERWWWLKPACLRVVLLDDEDREAHYILLDVDPSDEELAQLNEWARGNAPDERAGGDAGSATMSEALDRLEDEYLG